MCPSEHFDNKLGPIPSDTQRTNILCTIEAHTVVLILVGMSYFWLETRVIIKI